MDVDATSRIPGRGIAHHDPTTTIQLSAASRSSFLAGKMLRGADVVQSRPSRGHEDAISSGRPLDTLLTTFPLSNSDTSTTDGTDEVFTPPASAVNGQDSSSQESQLLHLSELAAAREKMGDSDGSSDLQSRKRMANGAIKGGHSRNTSTVSVASTTGSRIGDLSAELKTRLSYAMVKVNNGWQSHTIDQVETLASKAGSPTSSNSTIHLRQGASASPQLSTSSYRSSNNATPQLPPRILAPSLAPPITIEPSQQVTRRNPNPRHTPSLTHLGSPTTAPHTPGQSPYPDPMLFSPHQTPQQNVREQDAMEALLFMSSPGNSANLKHNFPSSSQPLNRSNRSSQPRKSLPSGRPTQNPVPHPYGPSRMRGDDSGTMEVDSPGSPHARGMPRRKLTNEPRTDPRTATPARLKQLPLSSGISGPPRPRPKLADADIDRMLDSVATGDSSDSEGEILIPVRAQRGAEVAR